MYSVENVEEVIKPWIDSRKYVILKLERSKFNYRDEHRLRNPYYCIDISKFDLFTSGLLYKRHDIYSALDLNSICYNPTIPNRHALSIDGEYVTRPVSCPTIKDINHIIVNDFLTFFDFKESSFSKQVDELTIEKMDEIHGKYRTWKETGKTRLDSFEKGIVEGFQPISIQTFVKSYGPCDLDEKLAQLKLEIVQKAYLPNTYRLCGYASIDEIKSFVQSYTLDIQNHIVKPKLDEIKYVDLKDVRRVLLEERKNHELELKEKIDSLTISHENELKSINERLETLNQDLKRVQDARDDLQVKLKEEQTKNSSLSETNKKLQEENSKLKNQLKIIFSVKEELENPSKLEEHHERLNLVENILAEDHERLNRMVYED